MHTPQILIVDDEVNNIEVLARLLQEHGLEAYGVDSLTEIDNVIAQMSGVDIIFLDIEFPNGDGFECLAKLRSNPQLDKTMIIAYSVHVDMIGAAHDYGFDGFLAKPLNSQHFTEQLERILRGEHIWEY